MSSDLSWPGRNTDCSRFPVMTLLEHIHNTHTGSGAKVTVPDQEFHTGGMAICFPRVMELNILQVTTKQTRKLGIKFYYFFSFYGRKETFKHLPNVVFTALNSVLRFLFPCYEQSQNVIKMKIPSTKLTLHRRYFRFCFVSLDFSNPVKSAKRTFFAEIQYLITNIFATISSQFWNDDILQN